MAIRSDIHRQAFWLQGTAGEQCFAWLHQPRRSTIKRVGILIVGPVGPEYMHSHRSIRYLADELAAQGFVSLRYDPLGMGNSSHDLADDAIADGWQETLVAAKRFFQDALNITDIIILSLRSGALLAREFMAAHPVKGAIFWYPYLKGSAFVRDLQIIDSMLHMQTAAAEYIEAGGYPLYPATQARLEAIDVLALQAKGLQQVLIINNAAQPPTKKLQQALAAQGVVVTQQNLSGLERMMKQSEITQVPEDNIAAILAWLQTTFVEEQEHVIFDNAGSEIAGQNFCERALSITTERPMFGVMTEPTTPDYTKPLLLFINGGSGHHVGPNRLYVDICRRLASDGFSSVRLDLSNLGDSAQDITPDSHNPYALTAAEDVMSALAFLRETTNYHNVVLSGLCSGAHNSFQAVLHRQSLGVREIILINPLAFYWKQGDSLLAPEDSQHEADAAHYSGNVRSLRKWISLFTNPQKLRNAFSFGVRLVQKKSHKLGKRLAGAVGVVQHSQLEKDLLLINQQGLKVTLLIGETEPGYRLLMAQAGNTVKQLVAKGEMHIAIIKDGDHTFSSRASRRHLIDLFVKQFTRYT